MPDITDFVNKDIVANVLFQQEFCIFGGIEVTVNIYKHKDIMRMTSWLNGCEELNTVDITDCNPYNMTSDEVISMMEEFINDNEEYIRDIASWNGD